MMLSVENPTENRVRHRFEYVNVAQLEYEGRKHVNVAQLEYEGRKHNIDFR